MWLAAWPLAAGPVPAVGAERATDVRPTREDHAALLEKLVAEEPPTPGTVRWIVELADTWRGRFGGNPWAAGNLSHRFTAGRARELALACWLARDDELAYRVLLEGLLCAPEPNDRNDAWIAGFITASDRSAQADKDLLTMAAWMSDPQRALKRLPLLRAAGRGREALAGPWPDRAPPELLEIAVENEAWECALRATVDAIADGPRRDLARRCIRILSRDPALLGRHVAPPNRTLQLLAGGEFDLVQQALHALHREPVHDRDLRAMAMDAVLAASYEARLTQALAAGEAVPLEVMQEYFRETDLLPDRARATRLAETLAAAPRCRRIYGGSTGAAEDVVARDGHRWVAAEALVRLGRGDLSFAVLRPVLEHAPTINDPPVQGYFMQPLAAAWHQGIELAAVAWPQATVAERMDRLATLTGKTAPARAAAMIRLARKHGTAMDKQQLLRWLWLPMCDLAHGQGVPDKLAGAARKLLESRAPDAADLRMLASFAAPPRVVDVGIARAQAGVGEWELIFDPPLATAPAAAPRPAGDGPVPQSLAGRWDPRSADFTVLDGLAAVRILLESRRRELADRTMQDLMERLCLDPSLLEQEVEITWRNRQAGFSSRRAVRVPELVLVCHEAWGFPAEWLTRNAWVCAHGVTGYADTERLLAAARAYEQAGMIEAAASVQRLYLFRTLSPGADNPRVEPSVVASCVRLDALAAARRGDRDAVLRGLRHYLQLMPYHPEAAGEVLAAWAGGEAEVLRKSLAGAVRTYWSAKLLEVPGSRTYQLWRDRWLACAGG